MYSCYTTCKGICCCYAGIHPIWVSITLKKKKKELGFLQLVFVWSFSPLSITYGYVEYYPASSNLFHCLKHRLLLCILVLEALSNAFSFESWFFLLYSGSGFQVWCQSPQLYQVSLSNSWSLFLKYHTFFFGFSAWMWKNGDSFRKFLELNFGLLSFYC